MPRQRINDIELYYEVTGGGEPLVLVHGGWTDHTTWQFVTAGLAERHLVVTYDRRGHSRTERPPGRHPRRVDEDDLVALIGALGVGPVHLVGNSFGAAISLGVASRRPDLVRSVTAHEPPLLDAAAGGSDLARDIEHIRYVLSEVAALIHAGDPEGAAARFVERIALGPGAWTMLPSDIRRVMVANAPTFLNFPDDPEAGAVPPPPPDIVPVLLTDGDASPAWLPAIVERLAGSTHAAAVRHTFVGAGHVPHLSHPAEFATTVGAFVDGVPARPPSILAGPASPVRR